MVYQSDAPLPWSASLQDMASPVGDGLSVFHNTVMFYLCMVVVAVVWLLGASCASSSEHSHKALTHGTLLELVWTVTPALLLVAVASPSFKLLYLMDENVSPAVTVKVVGRQWYWSVEYSDYAAAAGEGTVSYDVYMVPTEELTSGMPRLLAVDNHLVVPVETAVNLVVSGADVIHDLAVPALGIKVDAIPGRLNQVGTMVMREGLYYGQCSELCGSGHGFMPVCVEAVSMEEYLAWLSEVCE